MNFWTNRKLVGVFIHSIAAFGNMDAALHHLSCFLLDIASRIVCFNPLQKESTSGWENSGFYDDHSKLLLIKSRNFPKHFTRYNPQSVLLGSDGTAGYLICFISTVFFPLGANFAVTTRLGGILLLLLQLICATC